MQRFKQNQAIYMVLVAIILGIVLTACGDSTKAPPTVGVATTAPSTTTGAATTAPTTSLAVIPTVTPTSVAATTATTIAISDATTAANTTVATTTAVPTTPPATTTSAATATPPPTANPANLNKIIYADEGNLFAIDTSNKSKKLLGTTKSGGFSSVAFSPVSGLVAATSGEISVIRIFDLQDKNSLLFEKQPAATSDIEPTWSPDGKLLLFTRILDSNKDGKFDVKDKHELWLAENNGANPRKLTDGQQGTWASDGKRIAFVTDPKGTSQGLPSDNALHLINSEGKNEWEPINTKKIPSDWTQAGYPFGVSPLLIQYPAFVDGGKKIAFTGFASGAVLSVNAFDGKDVKLWAGNPEGGYGKVWGLGNLMLVESYPPSGIREVDIYNASGEASALNPPYIRIGGVRQNFTAVMPAFSPDGKRVAFIKAVADSSESMKPYKGTLVVATVKDGTLADQIELTAGTFWEVAWS